MYKIMIAALISPQFVTLLIRGDYFLTTLSFWSVGIIVFS